MCASDANNNDVGSRKLYPTILPPTSIQLSGKPTRARAREMGPLTSSPRSPHFESAGLSRYPCCLLSVLPTPLTPRRRGSWSRECFRFTAGSSWRTRFPTQNVLTASQPFAPRLGGILAHACSTGRNPPFDLSLSAQRMLCGQASVEVDVTAYLRLHRRIRHGSLRPRAATVIANEHAACGCSGRTKR